MKKLLLVFLTTLIFNMGGTAHPAELLKSSFAAADVAISAYRIDANTSVASEEQAAEIIHSLGNPENSLGIITDEYQNTYDVDIKSNGQDIRLVLHAEPVSHIRETYDKIAGTFENVYLSARGETSDCDESTISSCLMQGCGGFTLEECAGSVTSLSGRTPLFSGSSKINVQTAVVDKGNTYEVYLGFPYIVFEY